MKRPERPAAQPPKPSEKPKAASSPKAAAAPKAAPGPKPESKPDPAPRVRAARRVREDAPPSGARADRLRRRYEKAEVKRFTRRARRRRIGWLTALGILGATGALIAVAVFSPILALREIRVDGTSRLDPAVVSEAVSGQLGTPLALLDEDRLRRELGDFTTIRSYATELVPPGTLVIHVVERTPLGLVTTPAGFDVVDAAGVVLESAAARPAALPLLTLDDDGIEGRGFAAMAEVLVALPPDVLAQVDSIAARTRDDVTFTLASTQQRVVWGSAADSDRKAAVLATLLGMYAGSGPGEYDVSAPGIAVFRVD